MSGRMVDLVHVFNFRGESVLSAVHQQERIKLLEQQLLEEQRKVRSLTARLQAIASQ